MAPVSADLCQSQDVITAQEIIKDDPNADQIGQAGAKGSTEKISAGTAGQEIIKDDPNDGQAEKIKTDKIQAVTNKTVPGEDLEHETTVGNDDKDTTDTDTVNVKDETDSDGDLGNPGADNEGEEEGDEVMSLDDINAEMKKIKAEELEVTGEEEISEVDSSRANQESSSNEPSKSPKAPNNLNTSNILH